MMKTNILLALAALASCTMPWLRANEISLDSCPEAVRSAVQSQLRDGTLDEVEKIEVGDRVLYLADVDLPGGRDLKIHVDREGKVAKTVEEMAWNDLPPEVQSSARKLAGDAGHVDGVEKQTAGGKTSYLVEIERKRMPDLDAILAEDGAVLSRQEEVED